MKNSGATAVSAKPPSAQKAATLSPSFTEAPAGALRTTPATSLPGDERQRRFELVLAPGLQQLGKRHAGGVHLDHHPFAGREHVRGLRLGQLDQLERAVGARFADDLYGAHRRHYRGARPRALERGSCGRWARPALR